MELPKEYFFTKDHEWTSGDSGVVTVGLSSFAIEQLGDIVHLELPQVGDTFAKGDAFGTVESTKTVSDIYVTGTGVVKEVNEKLLDAPESLADSPYDNWLIKFELTEKADSLLTSEQYQDYLKESH